MIIVTDTDRREFDFYPTPYGLCEAALKAVLPDSYVPRNVYDPGAGNGVWGKAFRNIYGYDSNLTGFEIQKIGTPDNITYTDWHEHDYLRDDVRYPADLIMGNPPYNLSEEFISRSLADLSQKGILVFLLRLDFLASEKRRKGMWKTSPPSSVLICSRRPSFNTPNDRKTDGNSYAIYKWHKQDMEQSKAVTILDWLEWDYDRQNDY